MTGQALLDLAKTKLGQKYVLGALAPKDNSNYGGPWDCAEFTSWVVYQVSRKLYGCHNNSGNPSRADAYTGYWARDAEQMGKIIPLKIAAITPGAALLRVAAVGRIGHIVFADGKGGTIEAHSSKTGVIASTVSGRRWDYGVLVPWIAYKKEKGIEKSDSVDTVFRYTLPPMVSVIIGKIQRALKSSGFDPMSIDNIYGPNTARAVEAFQEANGLVVDGEVGKETAESLGVEIN